VVGVQEEGWGNLNVLITNAVVCEINTLIGFLGCAGRGTSYSAQDAAFWAWTFACGS
jgi:hypothetical protein